MKLIGKRSAGKPHAAFDGEGLETGLLVPRQSFTRQVFFKECKQILGLGKNRSRDFDSQVASTTITFIQYTILALYKRYDAYETIGGLFDASKMAITQQVFSDRIKILFIELIETLVGLLNLVVELEETISTIIDKTDIESKIALVFSTHVDIGGIKTVA